MIGLNTGRAGRVALLGLPVALAATSVAVAVDVAAGAVPWDAALATAIWIALGYTFVNALYCSVRTAVVTNQRRTAWVEMDRTATAQLAKWAPWVAPPLAVAVADWDAWRACVVALVPAGMIVGSLEFHRRVRPPEGTVLLRWSDDQLEELFPWWQALVGVGCCGGFMLVTMAVSDAAPSYFAATLGLTLAAAVTLPYLSAGVRLLLDEAIPLPVRFALPIPYLLTALFVIRPAAFAAPARDLAITAVLSALCLGTLEPARRRAFARRHAQLVASPDSADVQSTYGAPA